MKEIEGKNLAPELATHQNRCTTDHIIFSKRKKGQLKFQLWNQSLISLYNFLSLLGLDGTRRLIWVDIRWHKGWHGM